MFFQNNLTCKRLIFTDMDKKLYAIVKNYVFIAQHFISREQISQIKKNTF